MAEKMDLLASAAQLPKHLTVKCFLLTVNSLLLTFEPDSCPPKLLTFEPVPSGFGIDL